MILTDSETYHNLKLKDSIDIKCDYCSIVFKKTKRILYYSIYNKNTKTLNFGIKNFCSKECNNSFYQANKFKKVCLNCASEFSTTKSSVKIFCGKSCSVTYNNNKRHQNSNKIVNCKDCNNTFKVFKSLKQNYYRCKICIKNRKQKSFKNNLSESNIIRTCKNCSTQLLSKNKNAYFCSRKCIYQSSKIHDCICIGCNKSFKSERTHAKFCTNSCKSKNLNLAQYAHKGGGKSRSKIELFIEEKITKQYKNLSIIFNDKNIIGSEIDIYIPKIKLAIELNGIFHYENIFGEKTLKRIQNNDDIKIKKCLERGIFLKTFDLGKKSLKKSEMQKIYDDICELINKKLIE